MKELSKDTFYEIRDVIQSNIAETEKILLLTKILEKIIF